MRASELKASERTCRTGNGLRHFGALKTRFPELKF